MHPIRKLLKDSKYGYICFSRKEPWNIEKYPVQYKYQNFLIDNGYFTMEKVKEMYRLFKKHGLQLEGLSSFGRYIMDEEITRKRELADDLREHPEKLEALIAQGVAAQPAQATPDGVLKRAGPWVAAGVGTVAVALAWLLQVKRHAD